MAEDINSGYKNLKVITIINNKGGVAKSTLSKILCEYFVRKGKRVLGIDVDPQCNFSMRFVDIDTKTYSPVTHPDFDPNDPLWDELPTPPPGYWSVAQFYRLGYVVPYPTCYENMKFIPSSKLELVDFLEKVEKSSLEEEVINHMREMLSMDYYQDEFDVVIVDNPPQISALTASTARAATHILIPTEMQEDSVNGMADTSLLWQTENEYRQDDELKLIGIIPTKFDKKSANQRRVLEQLKSNEILGKHIIDPPMRYLHTYATSSATFADPGSIFEINEGNVALKETKMFCDHIYKKVFK